MREWLKKQVKAVKKRLETLSEKAKEWLKESKQTIHKANKRLRNFAYGKMYIYVIQTSDQEYQVGARSYRLKATGYAVLRDGRRRVATFVNAKTVIRL